MEAKSTDQKTFQLTDGGRLLGKLVYGNLFSLKAGIELTNSELYEVKPAGMFGTSVTVKKNGAEIASLKMNWRGNIVFSFQDEQEFILKAKGVFQNKFIIENKDEESLIQFDAKFNWKKFQYSYEISYNERPADTLLVLLGVYATNYYISAMSGAGATAGLA